MGNKKFVEDLVKKQQETINDLETLIALLDEDRLLTRNQEMQGKIDQYEKENITLSQTLAKIQDENVRLSLALNDQILNEKLNILKISRSKMETYFNDGQNKARNRLSQLESNLKANVQQRQKKVASEISSDEQELMPELHRIDALINAKIEERKRQIQAERNLNLTEIEDKFRQLQNEDMDQATLQKRIKQNSMEVVLGLSWLNKLGILLILLGVATAIKFSYDYFGIHLKGIFSFALGAILLGIGEFMMRKQKNTFAMGLSSGGIAVLYFATFSGYFFLHILSLNLAILLSVLVTCTAIVLSLRYDSKSICIFSLIGGYLPFFSYVFAIGLQVPGLYVAMAYVFLLNVMVLTVSLFRKWQAVNYVAFLLNIPVSLYLIYICEASIPKLVFDFALFALFLLIVLGYSLRQKISLNVYDLILLGINTTVSCATACGIFAKAGWNDYLGLLALLFSLFYYALGKAVDAVMGQEKTAKSIFYLTSITFAVLMIPFQFDVKWLTIGWTLEAVLMIIWGLRNRVRMLEIFGWSVLLLSYSAFLIQLHGAMYHFKFAWISVCLITAVLVTFKYLSNSILNKYTIIQRTIKYIVILHTFIYLFSESLYAYNTYLVGWLGISAYLKSYYAYIVRGAVLFGAAVGLVKFRQLQDRVVEYFSLALLAVFILQCLDMTLNRSVLGTANQVGDWVAFGFLIVYHAVVFETIRRVILRYISVLKYNLEIYPLSLAIYLLIAAISILEGQFDWITNLRFIISLTVLLLALAYIFYGLKRQFTYLRRMGLILAILANAKLFLFDLVGLTTPGRIAAYFSFGLILLAISYLYQKMEKSLNTTGSIIPVNEEENVN